MIRIGIIGFGNMGQTLARVFSEIEGVCVAGVAEVAPANVRAAEEQGIPCYIDFRQLLDQPLDGVYVGTPNALHRQNVLAAAARGLPIYCEKPIAISLGDADEMVRATEAAGVPTLVNFVYRFTDAYEKLRAYYTGGQLGSLLACWFRTFRGYGLYSAGVRHPAVVHPELSGGWVVHHAIHAVDWLISIGGPVSSVSARTFCSAPGAPSPEGIFGLLNFASGATALVADSVVALREHPAGIVGSAGAVTYDQTGMVRFCAETGQAEKGEEVLAPASQTGYLLPAARHFVSVVRGEEVPRATLRDGRYALQVVHALLEADCTNAVVTL
jgi:1,5-anhydro-D-fructose reductase (1,5-anhydro-D-mannitol-forming)